MLWEDVTQVTDGDQGKSMTPCPCSVGEGKTRSAEGGATILNGLAVWALLRMKVRKELKEAKK